MYQLLRKRLGLLAAGNAPSPLEGSLRGLERETLRVTPKGHIAQSDHPAALGKALTHPWITTDFSEAMVEFVTPPHPTNGGTLDFLRDLHHFLYARIDDELLWAASMPCFLKGEQSVRIAHYGCSLSARMREIYRRGLSRRYGPTMQTIAGVHFNFSPPEAFWPILGEIDETSVDTGALRDAFFFGLLRNYRRFGWLVLYLFGASPAVCHSFFDGRPAALPELLPGTHYGPHATTLRMSDIGYRNRRQVGLAPSMNNLEDYITELERAVQTPEAEYEKIGVRVDGEWRQLSANLLQIENELYGFVRPKQIVAFGERPNHALRERGVAYVEVRALDVNPFEPLGVGAEQLNFMEAFVWFCLLSESPPAGGDALERCDDAHRLVAARGREPGLELPNGASARPLGDWAREILTELEPICELLDRGTGGDAYMQSLTLQREKVEAPERTPSARVLAEISARGSSFYELARELSRRHRDELLAGPPASKEKTAELEEAARQSIVDQRELEASQSGTLTDYIRDYLAGA